MSIKYELRKLARDRGQENERRFIAALTSNNDCMLPLWLRSVRCATKDEDHHGIDAVLETDVGKIFFQVKSSQRGAEKHRRRRRRIHTIVMVVRVGMSDENIRKYALAEAQTYREKLLAERTYLSEKP